MDSGLMCNYRFSINDFTTDQVDQLMATCLQFGGNKVCKTKLHEAIADQRKEKSSYYSIVGYKRSERLSNELAIGWMKKLHMPEKWIAKLEDMSYHRSFQFKSKPYVLWKPPESEQSMILRNFSHIEALAGLQPGSSELSGFDRLKRAFFPKYSVPNYSYNEYSHVYNLSKVLNFTLGTATVMGLILAVGYGKRFVSDFDRTNGSNLYERKQDAHRARHNAFFKGYFRYSYRWGLRIAFLAGSIAFISQSLCIYTLKDRMSHYVLGAIAPFSLYKWTRGPKGMLITGTVGTLFFGLPLGFVMGVLGANPRPISYSARVQPELSSPHHWYNWTEKQKEMSIVRLNLLESELAKVYQHEGQLENPHVYDTLFSPAAVVSDE